MSPTIYLQPRNLYSPQIFKIFAGSDMGDFELPRKSSDSKEVCQSIYRTILSNIFASIIH